MAASTMSSSWPPFGRTREVTFHVGCIVKKEEVEERDASPAASSTTAMFVEPPTEPGDANVTHASASAEGVPMSPGDSEAQTQAFTSEA